jgi:hypothetical protein
LRRHDQAPPSGGGAAGRGGGLGANYYPSMDPNSMGTRRADAPAGPAVPKGGPPKAVGPPKQ